MITSPSNDFPMTIDSTMRASFVACPQLYFRTYFQHWKPKTESVDLVAGKAFASGIEAVRKAFWQDKITDTEKCLAIGVAVLLTEYGTFTPPERHNKQPERMVAALIEYFQHYGFTTDQIQPYERGGKAAIELSFALPIPGTRHPTTGEPILYTGRYDMVGVYGGQLFVIDEKTTSQLGQTWFKNWVHRSQITGYCWAAREFEMPVAGAIIRGISILKTKFGHAESIQYRPEWMVERWLKQLARDVNRMIGHWEENYWDYNLDTSCTLYGGCKLMEVCSAERPEAVLEMDFEKRIWDPLAREETVLINKE